MAIQDHTATLFNATGIDMKALTAWQTEHKQIAGFPGAETIASDAFWRLEMDILIPAALEGQITRQRAEALTCKLVLEGLTAQPIRMLMMFWPAVVSLWCLTWSVTQAA